MTANPVLCISVYFLFAVEPHSGQNVVVEVKGVYGDWTKPLNNPVSESCAVAKSESFWRATGQSNLADRMEDCFIGKSAVV